MKSLKYNIDYSISFIDVRSGYPLIKNVKYNKIRQKLSQKLPVRDILGVIGPKKNDLPLNCPARYTDCETNS
jgi:hypothetical protein